MRYPKEKIEEYREKLAARDLKRLAPTIESVGARFWFQLPEKDSELYNLVVSHVSPSIAADVTGMLLEGAERKEGGR